MTFDEAVAIVKDFGGGLLLDGLERISEEFDRAREEEDYILEITSEEVLAYHIVVREMRPLFA